MIGTAILFWLYYKEESWWVVTAWALGSVYGAVATWLAVAT
jgi:hypothetical protein